jgi:hypothetical protein
MKAKLELRSYHYQQNIFVMYEILHGQKKAQKEENVTNQMEKA